MLLNDFKITVICFFLVFNYSYSQTFMTLGAGFDNVYIKEKTDPVIAGGGLDVEISGYNPFVEFTIKRRISDKISLGILSSYRGYRVQAGYIGNFQPLDELGFRALRFGPEVTFDLDKKSVWTLAFGGNVNFYFDHYHRFKSVQTRSQTKQPYNKNTEFGTSARIGYAINKLNVFATYYRGIAYRDKELYMGYIDNVQSASLGISYRFYEK